MAGSLASSLNLKRYTNSVAIAGIGSTVASSQYSVRATIKSRLNGFEKTLDFLVVSQITTAVPSQRINRTSLNIPRNVLLADPEFHKPAPIQVLLGAGTTLSLFCVGQIKGSMPQESDYILQKTLLGWIIGGNLQITNDWRHTNHCYGMLVKDISLFWELEEVPLNKCLSQEEALCEAHFIKHTIRDPADNRFLIALPFINDIPSIGNSYHTAMKRLLGLERRFARNPELQKQYIDVMNEYIRLGYMIKHKSTETDGCFLPHQAVIKETSQTTKVRVVFDASAKSTTGLSLNEVLLAGPVIQSDLFSLLLRFRLHNYVLTGDIEKMYLQVKIQEKDRKYLQILWRDAEGTLSAYRFNRLLFGLKPASFLATRCLLQLAEDTREQYPKSASILQEDLYVDDLLTGAETVEEMVKIRKEISQILASAGFNLRQCASNSTEVIDTIPGHNLNLALQDDPESTLKTLGIHWNSTQDSVVYTVKPFKENRITKRNIFSAIASIYDPLGLLNPVVVTAKLLMQDLWRLKVDWDEVVPQEIYTRWNIFSTQLPSLNQVIFDRKMLTLRYKNVQIHGFCDASEKAYGACIYMRSVDETGQIRVYLYCARSRVAPIKAPQTIPRLELCAADLLSTLYAAVRAAIKIQIDQIFLWSDSMIVLHWINTPPHTLKTFVANRVASINSKTNGTEWRHVRTHDNPADLLSRGILPCEFKGIKLWTQGPTWLSAPVENWPAQMIIRPIETLEAKRITCLATRVLDQDLLLRFSSFSRLQRIVAWCLRIFPAHKNEGFLTIQELATASDRIIRWLQLVAFPEEYALLMKGKTVPSKSKLLNLNPFIGKDGLIRVGGRLYHSPYSYQRKHPVILPKGHHVTKLLIQQIHVLSLHAGTQGTLYATRQTFWPIDGRNQVRSIIHNCLRCAKAKPPLPNYVMGSLPVVRTVATRPFTNVGIDYCGPFYIKERRHRNRMKLKTYVSIFVCLSTKAVHLEVVTDMTTEAFLGALKRFISRRGKCASIYSDNGTNFVGAHNELQCLHELLKSDNHKIKVHNDLAQQGIMWHFNPPQAPHFGGIWEAAVKSFKHHLKRVVGSSLFTFEQLNTIVIEIEAVLNSRPLTPMSPDPNDLTVLTPAHFLIGDVFLSLPEQDLSNISDNRLSQWQHVQKIKRDFWSRWYKEYINELNVRQKWTKGTHPIKIGSIVLVRDDNIPPLQWKLGRVIETKSGHDGVIRTALIRTATGELSRCVKKLAPLPVDSSTLTS